MTIVLSSTQLTECDASLLIQCKTLCTQDVMPMPFVLSCWQMPLVLSQAMTMGVLAHLGPDGLR